MVIGIGYSSLSTALHIGGTLNVSKYIAPTLFNVMKTAAEVGTYAKVYTGNHRDSITVAPSQDIYYWKTSNASNSTAIKDMINVLFAGHCWQMIRTTDTGGVKLLYNGEADGGRCLENRSNHIGYNGTESLYMYNNVYYGTSYTFDSTTSKFQLSGTLIQSNWNRNTAPDLIGYYSCNSTSETGTCSTLYYMYAYSNVSSKPAVALKIDANAPYDSIGKLKLNQNVHGDGPTLAEVSYMFNDYYPSKSIDIIGKRSIVYNYSLGSISSFNANITDDTWFASSVSYASYQYTLNSPYHVSSNVDPTTLVGKYYANNSSGISNVYYIVGYVDNKLRATSLSNGKTINDYEPLIVGDSYIDNGDGTYTIQNTTSLSYTDWFAGDYYGKYTCGISNTTCNIPMQIVIKSDGSFRYVNPETSFTLGKGRNNLTLTDTITVNAMDLYENNSAYDDYPYLCKSGKSVCEDSTDLIMEVYSYARVANANYYFNLYYIKNFSFGKSVTWDGTKYTLNNVVEFESYNQDSVLSNHHYTCLESVGNQCETVTYLYYFLGSSSYFGFELSNGKTSPEDIIYETLKHNVKDSVSKFGIDKWYEREILDYNDYVENVIFFNEKRIAETGGLNPNGSGDAIRTVIRFSPYSSAASYPPNSNIITNTTTEAYSVENNDAKLKYSVGLPIYLEISLMPAILRMNNPRILTATAWDFNSGSRLVIMDNSFLLSDSSLGIYRVRPVISLKPGTLYSSGDGSMQNPYVVTTN